MDRSPNALSAVVVPSSNHSHAFLHLLDLLLLLRTSAIWTTIHLPDARTSHLRTLSKIMGIGLSAFPVASSFPPRRAAHASAVFASVNTLWGIYFGVLRWLRSVSVCPKRAGHFSATFASVNTLRAPPSACFGVGGQ